MINLRNLQPLSIKVNEDNTIYFKGFAYTNDKENKGCILEIPKIKIDCNQIAVQIDYDYKNEKSCNIDLGEVKACGKDGEIFKFTLIDQNVIDEYKKVIDLWEN